MKFVTRPPIDANGVGHGGDDLDEALFAFFRSEMPHPWPRLQLPNSAPPAPLLHLAQLAPAPSRRPWFRSPRFALAASLALLIGGYALMSAALTPPAQPDNPSLTGETANTKWNKKDMEDQDPIEDENLDVHEWLEQGKFGGTYHMELTPKK